MAGSLGTSDFEIPCQVLLDGPHTPASFVIWQVFPCQVALLKNWHASFLTKTLDKENLPKSEKGKLVN